MHGAVAAEARSDMTISRLVRLPEYFATLQPCLLRQLRKSSQKTIPYQRIAHKCAGADATPLARQGGDSLGSRDPGRHDLCRDRKCEF